LNEDLYSKGLLPYPREALECEDPTDCDKLQCLGNTHVKGAMAMMASLLA